MNNTKVPQRSNLTEKQQKKLQKLVKKQELSEKDKEIKKRVEGGASVSKKTRRKYNRIYYKHSHAQKKYNQYIRNIHKSHQNKETLKMMKETKKKSKARWMRQNGNFFQRWWYRNK